MSELQVSSLTIEDLLNKLRNREWLIPQFQRDFVWSVQDVIDLVHSILCARPIGMATIWEQSDDSELDLGPISLSDRVGNQTITRTFSDTDENPKKFYAVLDGLQRCTAIAMAFGGFHSIHGSYKLSGRYYLDVKAKDPLEQILYIREPEIKKNNYDKDASCIANGLFPLSSNLAEKESITTQWLRYVQNIKSHEYYPNGQLPDKDELKRRDHILKKAFEGINKSRLAVYTVPDSYNLAEICEIFETLNTTGTKVSTVDLIHSWLYADTVDDPEGTILLRDWINDLGTLEGAVGWASSKDRPELIVQFVTASYVALESKPEKRKAGRSTTKEISSVKASDLLSTPTAHWKTMIAQEKSFADYIGDFQFTVASGYFPWSACPYPVSAAIYVALGFHRLLDEDSAHPWKQDDLRALYSAFFWRNALANRYDQGFLTQLGADLKEIKCLLNLRSGYESGSEWAASINDSLTKLISKPMPIKEDLINLLTDGRPGGAMQKTLMLPMIARADKDLIDESIKIGFPDTSSGVQLHHIYPLQWCRSNIHGKLGEVLDPKQADRDWVNSIANLMPLSSKSNNIWKAKLPGQLLEEKGITFEHSSDILKRAFIDEQCFEYLLGGAKYLKEFWLRRASLIADYLLNKIIIRL